MPFLQSGDFTMHYLLSGDAQKPVLLFSNSLGTNLSMWDVQAAYFANRFRVLRYDTRGHGQSAVTPGDYTTEQLGKDVLTLLDSLKLNRVYLCGLSMGGMTGIWLAMNAPERLHKMVLCNTSAQFGKTDAWNTRMEMVRQGGVAAISSGVIERWFSPNFRANSPEEVAAAKQMLDNTSTQGYVSNCAAVRDFDARETLSGVRVPTLVVAGTYDPVTTPADGHFLVEKIAGAQYAEVHGAHISNLEAPDEFNRTVGDFLSA